MLAIPLPVRFSVCGLLLALLVIVSVALAEPAAAGVKVTLIAQLPLGATGELQLPLWAKFPALVPVTVRLETPSGAVPVLETVTACGWLGKLRDAGETVAVVGKRILETKASESPPPRRE